MLNAIEFIRYWKEYIFYLSEGYLTVYGDKKSRTNLILGHKAADDIENSFGRFLTSKISALTYRTEDGGIDLSFYSQENNFSNILSLNELESKRGNVFTSDSGYPKSYKILFEHENDILRCWEEMIKLTYFRAQLKVLVTHNWQEEMLKKWSYVNEVVSDNFQKIIKQANIELKESSQIEYLLIIGQKNISNEISWQYYIYSNLGEDKIIVR